MATKRHKAEKNQYNTNITKTTADIALTNVFEVTNTLPSGNSIFLIFSPQKPLFYAVFEDFVFLMATNWLHQK